MLNSCSGDSNAYIVQDRFDRSHDSNELDSDSFAVQHMDVSAKCRLDMVQKWVSCKADGYLEGVSLRWTTNSTRYSIDPVFEFPLSDQELLADDLKVTLEHCRNSFCNKLVRVVILSQLESPSKKTTPTPPPSQALVFPFEISENYDPMTKSLGGLSYSGSYVIGAFAGGFDADLWKVRGKKNPDLLLEMVPGTVLLASGSGTVKITEQQFHEGDVDPEGQYWTDWEVIIYMDNGLYYVVYDHVVDLMVQNGETIEQGDPIGKGRPGRIGAPGSSSLQHDVDWVEWGLNRSVGLNDGSLMDQQLDSWAICWEPYLREDHQVFVQRALRKMGELGFDYGDSVCLTDEFKHNADTESLIAW